MTILNVCSEIIMETTDYIPIKSDLKGYVERFVGKVIDWEWGWRGRFGGIVYISIS